MSVQEVAPGVYRMRLGEPDKVTPVGMRDTPILSEGFAALPPARRPPIAEAAVTYRPTRRGLVVELPLGEEEHVYGFGLQLKSHDQRGLKKTARVNSDPVGDTGDTHAPVPFYVSTAGYGVFVDTLRYASFYCGSHRRAADRAGRRAARGCDDRDAERGGRGPVPLRRPRRCAPRSSATTCSRAAAACPRTGDSGCGTGPGRSPTARW